MPSRTGFVYDDHFLDHDTGPGHPESPARLRAITAHLRATGLWQEVAHLPFSRAEETSIASVHSARHISWVRDSCAAGRDLLDEGDTRICAASCDVALLAAGGALAAADAIVSGAVRNAFCALRPPGHHAERDKPMGFCLFNNAAIAARYLQRHHHLGTIAIVDWDVHHGNGTQEIFYNDPTVLYISTHQYPYYPGTGSREERGEGAGKGFTLNIPMAAGSGDTEYLTAFTAEIIPSLNAFRPDALLLSAGFDAHRDDPLAGINLTEETFAELTRMMAAVAGEHCRGRLLSLLEGGYSLRALPLSVEAHLRVLLENA